MSASIYRTPDGPAVMARLYEAARRRLGVVCEDRSVETRFGPTHLLVTGPIDGPPLVVFHGGNCLNPMTLAWFAPLADRWRIYAPDTIGQPGHSAPTRPSLQDGSYGHWVEDLLDGLALDRAAMVGPSYGAGIILRAAAVAPRRIAAAVLVMPSGLTWPPLAPLLFRIMLPTLLYRRFPTERRLVRAVRPLFTAPPDAGWLEALEAVFRHVRIEMRHPRPARRAELAQFTAPALVLAGQRDPVFPAARVLAAARRVLPNLADAQSLAGWHHIPPQDGPAQLCRRIGAFLEGSASRGGHPRAEDAPG